MGETAFPENGFLYAYSILRGKKDGDKLILIGRDGRIGSSIPLGELEGVFLCSTPVRDPEDICFSINKIEEIRKKYKGRFYRF